MKFLGLEALAANGNLGAFAHANGLVYRGSVRPPALGGGQFERFTNAKVRKCLVGGGWLVGNLDVGDGVIRRPTTFFGLEAEIASNGPDANRSFPPIGYLALTLPHPLPNMILDSKRNKPAFGSSLMYPPTSDQRLSLEGDFNTHFDLYVPAGYERDALYIFTPDLMALLVDETGDHDVEIRGNQLLVYTPGGIDLSLPSTWDWIARVMSLVGAKMWSRTGQYSDGRATVPGSYPLAGGGELLRRAKRRGRVAFQAIVFVAVFAVGLTAFVLYNLRG